MRKLPPFNLFAPSTWRLRERLARRRGPLAEVPPGKREHMGDKRGEMPRGLNATTDRTQGYAGIRRHKDGRPEGGTYEPPTTHGMPLGEDGRPLSKRLPTGTDASNRDGSEGGEEE